MYKLKDLFDSGKNPGSNEWLYEITPFLGEAARKEFDEMTNGKPINPNLKRFGNKLKYSKKAGNVRNTDKPCNRWVFK